MKKICYLMTMTGIFLSLFVCCSEDKDEPVPTTLKVEGAPISVEAGSSTASFTVLSNQDWIAETEDAWLTFTPSSGKADSKLSVEVTVSANTETTSRSGVIRILAGDLKEEVTIEQKGKVVIPGIEIADPKFKQYLLENFDADKDGNLSTGEAEVVTKIACSGKEIESLSGIEHFVNLDTLICSSNALTKIDLSKNVLLKALDCSGNRIDSLGISKNIRLEDVNCSSNQLTEVDLTGSVNLIKLDCSSNRLAALDISKNVSLQTLNSSGNELTALDVSKLIELTTLKCSGNQLTTLDVSKNVLLETLDCTKNEALEKVLLAKDQTIPNLSYDEETTTIEYPAPEMKIVAIPDENFKAYMVANFDTDADGEISEAEALNIKEVRCQEKEITSLEGIASCVNLELLSCYKNELSSIDLRKNVQLTYLDCSTNALTKMDLSNNVLLEKLLCYACDLSGLDLQSNVALTEVNCYGNNLRTLDVSKNTLLQSLSCQRNSLSTLDLRKNSAINTLNCRENANLTAVYLEEDHVVSNLFMDTPPTSIVYPNYLSIQDEVFMDYLMANFDSDADGRLSQEEAKDVTEINCPELGIASLEGIEHFTNLTTLICSGNDLTSIDVSSNKSLVTLRCDKNRIPRLDVSKNTALVTLDCSENSLTSVGVHANKELTSLICNGNHLASLDVNNNPKLQTLHMQDNSIGFIVYLNKNLLLKEVNCTNNPRLKVLYLEPDQTIETLIKDDITDVWYVSDETPQNVYIPDENFKSYLLENYDGDDDNEISPEEAKRIISISCSSMGISSLSGIENFVNLRTLICDENNLTDLSLSENERLVEVNCYDNAISTIDVTGCTSLNKLICGSNNLTSLNLTKNTSLTYLDCSGNQLSALNVRYNPSLNTLICTNNPSITILLAAGQYPDIQGAHTEDRTSDDDVSFADAAFESYMLAYFDANRDGSISEVEAQAVTEINCSNRGITSLKGLENFSNLKEFDCSNNEITGELDMSSNSRLTHLNCADNKITSVNVAGCASLLWFMCSNNRIGSVLDLRANTALNFLDCIINNGLDDIILSTTVQGNIIIDKDDTATVQYVP